MDPKQRFVVRTVKPARANASDAPHIDVVVTMRGMLAHTFTRLYFDDETAANAADPMLSAVPAGRLATRGARHEERQGSIVYHFDIHTQREHETVFFDL